LDAGKKKTREQKTRSLRPDRAGIRHLARHSCGEMFCVSRPSSSSNKQRISLMTNATTAELLSRPTITVEEFMQITRSGRNSTYAAIATGEIKTFRVGRVHKIGTDWLKAKLGIVAA
jgi:hypothetical protein